MPESPPTEPAAPRPLAAHGRRRIAAQVWDASLEAARLREAAGRDAGALLARAGAEAEEIRARAARAGREEGLDAAAGVLAAAALERDRLLAGAESALVDLAFEIAGRIVGRLAERDRALVVGVAARALEAARAPVLTLRANAGDLEALRDALPALGRAGARPVRLVSDPSVARGGVVVESETCRVDARLEVQLDLLRRAMRHGEGGSP
jgi:flagellar biosynthesis/type III secretory pathway protein FliH